VELIDVVCNLFDCRSHASGTFYEGLKREWGDKVVGTIIHRNDKIGTCASLRKPVQTYAPTSVAATLYADLVDELLLRLDVTSVTGYASTIRVT